MIANLTALFFYPREFQVDEETKQKSVFGNAPPNYVSVIGQQRFVFSHLQNKFQQELMPTIEFEGKGINREKGVKSSKNNTKRNGMSANESSVTNNLPFLELFPDGQLRLRRDISPDYSTNTDFGRRERFSAKIVDQLRGNVTQQVIVSASVLVSSKNCVCTLSDLLLFLQKLCPSRVLAPIIEAWACPNKPLNFEWHIDEGTMSPIGTLRSNFIDNDEHKQNFPAILRFSLLDNTNHFFVDEFSGAVRAKR